jgi:segregation and condensation protein B
MNLKAVFEGLLFVSGEEGISKESVLNVLNVSLEELDKIVDEYLKDSLNENRGIQLETYGDRYKLITKKEHAEYYKKLVDEEISDALSASSLETLAIIAYNQPITRVTVDEIRGVSSAYIIRKLVLKNLIREVGRSELPGRPILYGVTDQFLDYFGLKSIDDLPKIEYTQDDEESELFTSKYTE